MSRDTSSNALHILLISNAQHTSTTLGARLGAAGYMLTGVANAHDALVVLEQHSFNLAIVDEDISCAAGLGFIQTLRERFRLPFIVLTTCGEQSHAGRAISEGALAYVIKPVDVHQLQLTIATALARGTDLETLRDTRDQLQHALNQERDVSIATGMLMALHGLNHDNAYEVLRQEARSSRRKLSEVARGVIDSRGLTLKT